MVSVKLYFEGLEEKGDSINLLISHKGVCRISLATPGLLNIFTKVD